LRRSNSGIIFVTCSPSTPSAQKTISVFEEFSGAQLPMRNAHSVEQIAGTRTPAGELVTFNRSASLKGAPIPI
jgi:hypothetical protein